MLRVWMDVMRHLEPVMNDHQRLFDAWEAGGVDGLVIGPMAFDDKSFTFDPNPEVYARFGLQPPPPDDSSLWWRAPAASDTAAVASVAEKRDHLARTLQAAKDRGWQVWLFCPHYGAGPGVRGPLLVDDVTRAVVAARLVDCMEQYPMADGAVFDGPEWGYEIAPFHQNHRSSIFNDLPPEVAEGAERLGYTYSRLVAAKDRLFERLHHLSDRDLRIWGQGEGGFMGTFGLLGQDPALAEWLAFRTDSLSETYQRLRQLVQQHARRPIRLASGPRSAAWASLCGYDFTRLEQSLDVLLPKHYFWHRGFDGMYGTVARYVQTLTEWNPGLSERGALQFVDALFGIDLPGITSLRDFDRGFPQEFFDRIVTRETERALVAMGDPERVCPWIDAGRKPHDGEPFTPHDLDRLLTAAEHTGLRRFLYHHHGNLTPGEWAVISAHGGRPWQTTTSPRPILDPDIARQELPGYYPPDLPIL
ncbi:MAG: hypothetical protein M3442_02835 [Chloroflexota bacterium]|nr:hypothetical protein [Chloroflexota bacterium]